MVALLPASAEDLAALRDGMLAIGIEDMPDWMRAGQPPKTETVTTLACNGQKFATVWAWVSEGNRTLVVNALVSHVKANILPLIERGITTLADRRHCIRVRFFTNRRGMVERMRGMGCSVDGVSMSKIIVPIM